VVRGDGRPIVTAVAGLQKPAKFLRIQDRGVSRTFILHRTGGTEHPLKALYATAAGEERSRLWLLDGDATFAVVRVIA